jgi:hypothetical protein
MSQRNVIILTAGLTGSSVIAGMLKNAGYWAGSETVKKSDYDTFENRDLIAMNDRLLKEVEYPERFDRVFRREQVDQAIARMEKVDAEPYRQFIQECNCHEPWIWKDPRLYLTIRFWAMMLDHDRLQAIVLTREFSQVWVSHTLRRQIQTPAYLRNYMDGITRLLVECVEEYGLCWLQLTYEDILLKPEYTLQRLESFLGINISLDDLRRTYRGRLYRRHYGIVDYMHAILIYAKNLW